MKTIDQLTHEIVQIFDDKHKDIINENYRLQMQIERQQNIIKRQKAENKKLHSRIRDLAADNHLLIGKNMHFKKELQEYLKPVPISYFSQIV